MDIIIGWKPFECMFNGKKITMKLRPLNRGAYLAVEPHLNNNNPRQKDEDIKTYLARLTSAEKTKMAAETFELQEKIREIGPDHVSELRGITINGQPPTWDQLADEVVLNNLAVQIITQLVTISTIVEIEEKNSDGLSGLIPSEEENSPALPAGPLGAGLTCLQPVSNGAPMAENGISENNARRPEIGSCVNGRHPEA